MYIPYLSIYIIIYMYMYAIQYVWHEYIYGLLFLFQALFPVSRLVFRSSSFDILLVFLHRLYSSS